MLIQRICTVSKSSILNLKFPNNNLSFYSSCNRELLNVFKSESERESDQL